MTSSKDPSAVTRFDDALPAIVNAVYAKNPELLETGAFLRAVDGRISFILPDTQRASGVRTSLENLIAEAGGPYVDQNGACVTPDELFQPDLLGGGEAVWEDVKINQAIVQVKVIERRIVGQDWTRPNFAPIEGAPPIVSFFSCKGGVGRSTALAIASAGLAEMGHNILIVDLDMEAPGLGVLLLSEDDRPEFGAIDYLVENGISGVDEGFVRSCIAPSPLTRGSRGIVDVLPAVGQRGIAFPGNLIPKLGRALLDDPDNALVSQVRQLLAEAARTKEYDAIFVDVRAGLSESSAAALLSLGGDMLLFGVDTPQTFESYRYLFAHMRRYATAEINWRTRLQMVQAKSPGQADDIKQFREKASDLFAEFLYDDVPAESESPDDAFNFDIDDDLAPHYAWMVQFDPAYLHFDPVAKPEQLDADRFQRAFGGFIDHVHKLIVSSGGDQT